MGIHTVNALSISKIGELLIEQLGEDAADYTFPEDFEKAVVDIGFAGCVMTGDSSPYDLVVIGDSLPRLPYYLSSINNPGYVKGLYKSVGFIGEQLSIPVQSFYRQNYLADVVLPSSCENIDARAFAYCTALEHINLENVKQIGPQAFFDCTSLKSVNLSNVESIDVYGAFAYCTALEHVSLPKLTYYGVSNTTQAEGLFQSCTALESIDMPLMVELRCSEAYAQNGNFRNCTVLKTVNLGSIGHDVHVIGKHNFTGCTQSDLIVTVYTLGSYVDELITNIRNSAINATIVIKAAANLVYDGDSYAAGETVLTSEP